VDAEAHHDVVIKRGHVRHDKAGRHPNEGVGLGNNRGGKGSSGSSFRTRVVLVVAGEGRAHPVNLRLTCGWEEGLGLPAQKPNQKRKKKYDETETKQTKGKKESKTQQQVNTTTHFAGP